MRIIKYLLVFLVGVIAGVVAIIVFSQLSKEGIILKQDATLYVGRGEPVAIIRKGTILIRDKHSDRYEFSFYLFQTEGDVRKPIVPYYTDIKIE